MTKKLLWLMMLAALLPGISCKHSSNTQQQPEMRTFTDMAGRQVQVPKQIHRVLGMSPMGTVFIYTLDPSVLAGWNYKPDPGERALLLPQYQDLPVLGGWFGKDNTGNMEKIMLAKPDVLISMGDPQGKAQAERVQAQTHIPVVILDGRLEALPDTYAKASELIGSETRAKLLGDECAKTIQDVKEKVATIPEAKRRRYYYAEGPKGLETEPGGSMHSEALNFAGGANVASGVNSQPGYGHSPVSMEQVLRWNPEIIISGYDHNSTPGEFYTSVWKDSRWKHIQAVQHREVYETPQYPFCWIDRPPTVNRLIGIRWLAALFYPKLFPFDLREETRHFYKTFYQIDLNDQQLNDILNAAERKPLEGNK